MIHRLLRSYQVPKRCTELTVLLYPFLSKYSHIPQSELSLTIPKRTHEMQIVAQSKKNDRLSYCFFYLSETAQILDSQMMGHFLKEHDLSIAVEKAFESLSK